jgi:hypothetical protein
MLEISRIAEVYGSGEIRLTVEQNVIIPNISDRRLEAFLTEPILDKFAVNPSALSRGLVSCTGAQFCNFTLVETKNRAVALVKELESELTLEKPVRIHWTGCPNSCGQPQVADIGLMGTKVRSDVKVVKQASWPVTRDNLELGSGDGQPPQLLVNYNQFSVDKTNCPDATEFIWIMAEMARWGITPFPKNWVYVIERVLRTDVYGQASRELGLSDTGRDRQSIKLFDGTIFNPHDPIKYLKTLKIKQQIRMEEIILDPITA